MSPVSHPSRFARLQRTLLGALALLGTALLSPCAPAQAAGDLMVTPTRVILSGNQRSAVLSLVNTGKEATTYRISIVFRRMNESGNLEPVKTPNAAEELAGSLIRYSPREVTLPPGITQNIRVQIRKPADLPPGEYRAHMLFLEVPPAESAQTSVAALNGEKPKDVAVKLTQIYGISIPVIVRHGETSAAVSLHQLKLSPPAKPGDPPLLSLEARRTGNRSIYGECTITFVDRQGAEKVVGRSSSVAIYTPLTHREVLLPLTVPAGVALREGRLKVSFKEAMPAGAKPMAEAELALP
jgi:P pilus assembly chaperone PapD